ncbi:MULTISPECIES: response regulator [Pseudanabaena]|uniref:histidine kinase n=2 Tax=Pseudanabaena TaxID=1152 RepID=L8MXC5_9CYAN|nr:MULTISPECIES: response regulator [Pseudanabaena]ELS31110.1 putative CheA signal transduction histidine kinase [Pseudanabaena biceps PCC 7429]MDG3496620.1 response regulator [Pseudanabaena catenata USMAC16]
MIEILPQPKKIFSEESQVHTQNLKNKVLELDATLPNFREQIDSLIATNKLLQDAAVRADFCQPNSAFAEIIKHFEEVFYLLRDRHSEVDWITKELLLEIIGVANQIINEFCLEIETSKDWMKIQGDLFEQLHEDLSLELEVFDTLEEINSQDKKDKGEPFGVDNTSEGMHLFDIDFRTDLDSDFEEDFANSSYINNINISSQLNSLDGFLIIQEDRDLDMASEPFEDISGMASRELEGLFPDLFSDAADTIDSLDGDLDGDPDEFSDSSGDLGQETLIGDEGKLPKPEILADIFTESPFEVLANSSDPHEYEPMPQEISSGESIVLEDILEEVLEDIPEDIPEARYENPLEVTSEELINGDGDEAIADYQDHDNIEVKAIEEDWIAEIAPESDRGISIMPLLRELEVPSESSSFDLIEDNYADISISSDFFEAINTGDDLSIAGDFFESLEGDLISSDFFESLEQDDISIGLTDSDMGDDDRSIGLIANDFFASLKQDKEQDNNISVELINTDFFVALEQGDDIPDDIDHSLGLHQDFQLASLAAAEIVREDFSVSDIDTSLEESPIYHNSIDDTPTDWQDLSQLDLGDREMSYAEFANLSLTANYEMSPETDGGDLIEARAFQGDVSDNEETIRLPLNHVELLGDLSEELLLRKGNLDVYLEEMQMLSGEVQKHFQLLEPKFANDNPEAIANLQGAIARITNVIELADKQTDAMSHDICHLRKNLRQVLKCPVSSLVRKFPRILREMSLHNGKQVELIVKGAEIGLERAMAAVVAESMEVLLRNALDHGIESVDDRQRIGKTPQGKIELIATQSDEGIQIKVCDDGRGLDMEKIRQQFEQAIADRSEFSAVDMSDEQLTNLIFEPDFDLINSSIQGAKLSDVRAKLSEFGGSITVHSEMGKGTQFTLMLPNLLSLMRVLLIDIDRMCLAISSKNVWEVISIEDKALNQTFEGKETLLWRDRVLPIVQLNSLLQINCRQTLSQGAELSQSWGYPYRSETQSSGRNPSSFLVIHHENNFFALQADGCWHEQEATFQHIEGDILLPQIFLGSVILGNNQAVALLNPAELASQFLRSLPKENEQLSRPHPVGLNNLSSLSDFFSAGDRSPELPPVKLPMQVTTIAERLERSPKSENLESSGLFTDAIAKSSPRKLLHPRVLIVESSANVRRYLAMTLTKSGFVTEQVQNAKEALALLKTEVTLSQNFDVMITDLEMPHMDGFKLLSTVRSDTDLCNLPIVALMAKNNENGQKLALELGANACFSKPYQEKELVNKLKQLIA